MSNDSLRLYVSDSDLVKAIKDTSYSSVRSLLIALKIPVQTKSYKRVHALVKSHNLDTSHWRILHIDSERGKWKHYTENELISAIKNPEYRSLQEMLRALCPGVSVSTSHQSARVFACIDKHGLDTSHWSMKRVYHDMRERKSKKIEDWWTQSGKEAEAVAAIKNPKLLSLRMVSNAIGGTSNANWYHLIKKTAKKFGLDTAHWKPHRGKPYYQLGYYFVKNHPRKQSSSFIRKKLEEKRGRRCEKCGNTKWMGGHLIIELHHKDGDPNNNLEDNLELLCLNCHGQTPNYRIHNRRGRPQTPTCT